MGPVEVSLILLAAIGAGALNAVVGAGTLVTFPTLLALGIPPVIANVSNTVGLVPGSIAGAYAFRATIQGKWHLVRRFVVASSIGGLTGGALLLVLPVGLFEMVVPLLLVFSGVLAAVQPQVAEVVLRRRSRVLSARSALDPQRATLPLLLGIAATGVYGGYFGAAQGVILLALLGIFLQGGITQVNGIKNILAGVANLLSALLFIAIADVDWSVVFTIAVGATIGGGLGGRYGRQLPARALRAIVVAIALIAAAWQVLR